MNIQWPQVNPYIQNRNPLVFGEKNQEEYRAWMIRNQGEEAKLIKKIPKEESALVEFFYTMIERLSASRRELAERHNTEVAEFFGFRRELNPFKSAATTFPRDGIYGEYTKVILERMSHIINRLIKEKLKSHKEVDCFENLNSSVEIKLISADLINNPIIQKKFPKWFPLDLFAKEDLKDPKIKMIKKRDRELKKREPELYQQIQLNGGLQGLNQEFPSPICIFPGGPLYGDQRNLRNSFALATLRIQVGNAMLGTTKWLTWLHRSNDGDNPVPRMLVNSSVLVIHMDKYLIDPILKQIAELFAKAVCAGKENPVDLQKYVGLMLYHFSHCMPFLRGSSSISEVIEGAIYEACDFKVLHNPNLLADLEALSTSKISEFMKKYPEMIELAPKADPVPSEEKTP